MKMLKTIEVEETKKKQKTVKVLMSNLPYINANDRYTKIKQMSWIQLESIKAKRS